MDSQFLEMILTAPGEIGCRVPHKGEVHINPRRYFYIATSNGFESTTDFANRACIIRLRKQPMGYRFKLWPEGSLIEHVRANQPYYLGCVHAVIRAWWTAGAPQAEVFEHDFREWARTIEGIIHFAWPASAPLMTGHREAQARMADPSLTWLRSVCLEVEAAQRLDEKLSATSIAELCADQGIDIPGLRGVADDNAAKKQVGRILSKIMKEDIFTLDEYSIARSLEKHKRNDGEGNSYIKVYQIRKTAPTALSNPIDIENVTLSNIYGGLAAVGAVTEENVSVSCDSEPQEGVDYVTL
jgi:hypothetical protein